MKWTTIIIILFVLASIFINISDGFYIQPRAIQFSAPPTSQSLLMNSSLHLSCGLLLSSDWLPAPVIYWYHNGNKMDSEGAELVINTALPSDAGDYHCSAVDGNMTSSGQPVLPTITISQKAHVNVIGILSPSYQNHSITSCSSLLMRCLGDNAPPPSASMGLVWTRNGETLSTNNSTVYRMTERGDLHVRGDSTPVGGVSGVYRCLATSAMVLIAEHNVTGEEQNGRGSLPLSISIQSSATLLLSGSPFHLMCLLKSACDYSDVQWTKDGQTLEDMFNNGVVISNDVMEINSTTPEHSGNYCCQLSGDMSCQYITVIASQSVNTSTDVLNTSLPTTLSCTTGSSNLSVEWYRNGDKISAGIDGTSLAVPSTSDNNVLGVYQCFIVNMTGPAIAQYRILPYGLPNPPHSLTHSSLPTYVNGLNISFQWQPPLHTAGLNQSALKYRIVISGFSATVGTTEYRHMLSTSFISNYSWSVVIVDNMEMISEPSNEVSFSGSHLINYPPKAPLLSLSCVNQTPVLNWTEVAYGYYKPQQLCVKQTCHSNTINTNTTDEQCSQLLSFIDDTGSVVGSVAVGVATRCTFTAWQITAAAPFLIPSSTTVTGTPTTTHTDCGYHITTDSPLVSQYTTTSFVSVTMTSLPVVGEDGNIVSTTDTLSASKTSFNSMTFSPTVSVAASSNTDSVSHRLSILDTTTIITSTLLADISPSSSMIVLSTSPIPDDGTIVLIVSVAFSILLLLIVLFAAMCITILLITRRRSKRENIFNFIHEDTIPQYIPEDTLSIKTVYESPSPIKKSKSLSDSSLPHIQAIPTDDREAETIEEEQSSSVFETGEMTHLDNDFTAGNDRLTVVNNCPSSENSSRRTSKNSDTSSSTVYSEDSSTGYLRFADNSSGYNSDYPTAYHKGTCHKILEESPTGQNTFEQPKILRDTVSCSELVRLSASEEAVQEQRRVTLEEDGSRRSSREWTLSPPPSSFSSNVSTFTETTV